MLNPLLYLSLLAFGSTLVLTVLAPYARRCAAALAAYEAYMSRTAPVSPRLAVGPLPSLPPIRAEQTASHHLEKMVNHGLLGVLYLTVLPVAFILNSQILAEGFEVLFDRAARVIAELPLVLPLLGSVTFTLTDFQAYGLAMALAQVLLGASLGEDWEEATFMRWVVLLAGEIPFLAFMCWAAWERGQILAMSGEGHLSPLKSAMLSGLQAYVLALVDALAGRWVIHRLLLPFWRGMAWGLVSPFRALLRRHRLRRLRQSTMPRLEHDARAPRKPGSVARAFAYVDAGLFEPLRTLDGVAGRILRLR